MGRVALLWLASRLLVMGLVVAVAWAAGVGPESHPLADGAWLVDRFVSWDAYHYGRIAEQGYLPPGLPCCDQAYFPGYPLLMAALAPVTGGSVYAAGLLVSLMAGTAAAALLWVLAREVAGSDSAARRAVLLLALAPAGVFFTAVYTEALFLALALGAWLAGRRGRWRVAGLLCALVAAADRRRNLATAVSSGDRVVEARAPGIAWGSD
jgi:Gpi18-like mannosyltransferase